MTRFRRTSISQTVSGSK